MLLKAIPCVVHGEKKRERGFVSLVCIGDAQLSSVFVQYDTLRVKLSLAKRHDISFFKLTEVKALFSHMVN